jgi:hypothetical protein
MFAQLTDELLDLGVSVRGARTRFLAQSSGGGSSTTTTSCGGSSSSDSGGGGGGYQVM